MKIYDTMTRYKEEFQTIEPGKVRMYVCGPTVYNLIHIGNARPMIFFDTVRRYLEYKGYEVNFVSNFTDVDDKIIKAANEEGVDASVISERYIAECKKDMAGMNVRPASYNPRATEEIPGMIDMIQKLIDGGHAYVAADGTVYYRVESFPDYGKLSHKNVEENQAGLRTLKVRGEEAKEDPNDFVLWKPKKEGEPYWESPWCEGRPGWHIECSVMSTEILGDTIDIHGGGADLEFPHHTNEIAQSEAKTGQTFANYWMHNGFVNIDDVKMSKSLGNFITVHDALKTIDGQVLRFFFATQHYRKPINFTEKAVHDAAINLKYLKNTYEQPFTDQADSAQLQALLDKFTAAMDEDFNAANGITVVFELAKWINSGNYTAEVKEAFAKLLEVFGIVFVEEVLDADIERLIEERQTARAAKDFATADKIRDELAAQGIRLLDGKDGVRWTRD